MTIMLPTLPPPTRRVTRLGMLLGMLVFGVCVDARAQQPQPLVPLTEQRSGLITRHLPTAISRLPVDEDRDVFYETEWEDRHPKKGLIFPRNSWLNGGMYGKKLSGACTKSVWPFFRGSPGQSTVGADCVPPSKYGRYLGNFVHPFRPVGMYYANGSYVPIYDLDPFVPGPGPFPWNHYLSPHTGG